MTPRVVTVDEARAFWAHPSQHEGGFTEADLPAVGVEYVACGPICCAFRPGPWPGVVMADYGARPEGWGRLDDPGRAILFAFWGARLPAAIMGWTDSRKRAALAFSRRLGFERVGQIHLEGGREVVMQVWRPGNGR